MNTYRFRYMSLAVAAVFAAHSALAQQTPIPDFTPATLPATPRPPATPDPTLQKIVKEISQDHITATLQKLESFTTRNTMSDPTKPTTGIGPARQWILDQFKSYSPKLQVAFDTYTIPKSGRILKETELRNVVAILPGKTEEGKNRWILISGHYDTVNLRASVGATAGTPAQQAEAPAPGVCDDGSGTACTMECARVLSQYDFDATLVFVAFAGEEQGLVGAHAMAKRLRGVNQDIETVLNNDIIGTDTRGNGEKDDQRVLVFSEDPDDSPSREVARFVRETAKIYYPDFAADMVFRYDRFARGGDHTAFNQEGYSAVRITTPAENFANQHTANDTFANMSPTYTTKVTRVNAVSAALLALAPKPPITMPAPATGAGRTARSTAAATTTPAAGAARGGGAASRAGLSRGGSGYDAVMRWDYPNPPEDLAGFLIVIRSTTSPEWQKEIWAGNVRTFTLKDCPIDQLVIGIKAVDKEGHASPASAYVNAPRSTAGDLSAQ